MNPSDLHLVSGHEDTVDCQCEPEITEIVGSPGLRSVWHRDETGKRIGAHAPDGRRAVTTLKADEPIAG